MCSIPSFCHLLSYFCSAAIYIGYIIETQHNYSALSSLLLNALLLPLHTSPPASPRSSQSWKNPRYFRPQRPEVEESKCGQLAGVELRLKTSYSAVNKMRFLTQPLRAHSIGGQHCNKNNQSLLL